MNAPQTNLIEKIVVSTENFRKCLEKEKASLHHEETETGDRLIYRTHYKKPIFIHLDPRFLELYEENTGKPYEMRFDQTTDPINYTP